MSIDSLRLLVAVAITALLFRGARVAWGQRSLALAIWCRIRPRHVLGALALLAVLLVVAGLLLAIPPLRFGIGTLLGFGGNVVFAPLEEAAVRAGASPAGPDWVLAGIATAFLLFLGLLLPWFAYVEEEIFRAGLETAGHGRELLVALAFGLVHLVMLVPLAAALAIGVAGFVYGRVYRYAYHRAFDDNRAVPDPAVLRTYRPTRRARAAAGLPVPGRGQVTRAPEGAGAPDGADGPDERAVDGENRPPGEDVPFALVARRLRAQASALHASSVWHTTFNSLVLVLVWIAIVTDAVLLRL
jgi:hypothetical protein